MMDRALAKRGETGRSTANAIVSIVGSAGSTCTDAHCFFSRSAKAAKGEEVRLRAAKQGYETLDQYHPAGDAPAYFILKRGRL